MTPGRMAMDQTDIETEHPRQEVVDERLRHRAHTREFGEDSEDVREWTWPE